MPSPPALTPSPVTVPAIVHRSTRSLVVMAILGWLLFLLTCWALFPIIGKAAAILNLLLLAGLAWYGGMRYGVFQALTSSLLLPVFMTRFTSLPESLIVNLLVLCVSLALTVLVGHLRDVRLSLLATQQRLIQSQEDLRSQAEHDVLTGLHNRRFFNQRLDSEHARAERYALPLSVVLLDVDRFKQVNDRYSHAVGDQVLQLIARLLQSGIREIDSLARYGGEEFALCLPSTSTDGALVLCERLRASIEAYPWEEVHPGLRVTISGGIFSGPPLGPPEHMLSVADHRLYLAKEAGRNRLQGADATGSMN